MRNLKQILFFLSFCFIINTMLQKNPASAAQMPDSSLNDKRACWISYLDFERYLRDLDEQDFRAQVSRMYDRILGEHLNTVIVHVRAFGDAVYPSAYFPYAEYLYSDRKARGYDALKIMTELAHEKGLFFEAWINPYRLSKDDKTTQSYMRTAAYERYLPHCIVYETENGEQAIALNPSDKEAQALIINGVREILDNYEVDGIHFDDYFYMAGMADTCSVEQKKEHVNALVRGVYACVHMYDGVSFGISPAGNCGNARKQGADIDRWLSESGYVDYIMPQLYWSDSFKTASGIVALFSERCGEWADLNRLDLPIYAGLALYRAGEADGIDTGWSESDTNLTNQCQTAYARGYDGYALFRYAWLEDSTAAAELSALREYICEIPDGGVCVSSYIPESGAGSTADGVSDGTGNSENGADVTESISGGKAGWHETHTLGAYIDASLRQAFFGQSVDADFFRRHHIFYGKREQNGIFGPWKLYRPSLESGLLYDGEDIRIFCVPDEDIKKYLIFPLQVL